MEEKLTFGKFISKKRKEAELTQRDLADQLFVTESAVSKWERGDSDIKG
jgi:transcriptional regulator with XRE-family HTH domain